MPDIFFKYQDYKILERGNGDCFIKDNINNKYYVKRGFYFSRMNKVCESTSLHYNFIDVVFAVLIIFSFYAFLYLVQNIDIFSTNNALNGWVVIYLFFNIVIHEMAHALTLKYWGGKAGKVKLRFFLFFPVVKLDTSDVYLLPRFRGACVCYAGILINIMICYLTYFFDADLYYLLPPVLFMTLSNIIPLPILKNDGYNILVNFIFTTQNKQHSFFNRLLEIIFLIFMTSLWVTYLCS